MPRLKVLVDGRFGEGWMKGDIIEMDNEAARVPLEEGSVEIYDEKKPEEPKKEVFICDICGKVCKNKVGLMGHKKTHK